MELLRSTIKFLTVASLGFAAVQIYLTLNKIWKRKHERAVAESISIMGEFVGFIPLVFLTTNYLLEGQWVGVIDGSMWMFAIAIMITIGTGRWVEGRSAKGFWTLLREALKLERGEVGDLAKAFFRPSGAEVILKILGQIALIDQHLDEREKQFIQSFADAWGIKFSPEDLLRFSGGDHINYINLRRDVADYLATSPPHAQVEQLGDVLKSLVEADQQVTAEEELILTELNGMLGKYLHGYHDAPVYGVAIVPQDDSQDAAIAALLPSVRKRSIEGGRAYVTGEFFSQRYAEIISEQYQQLSFFATVVELREVG